MLEPPILKPLPLPASICWALESMVRVPLASQETEAKVQSFSVLSGVTLIQPLR